MSYNQSNRSEKIETTQYRKTDRRSSSSNQQRSSSGAYGKGGGGPAPSPSYNSSNSRSFKKNSNNAQGGQSRAHVPTVSVNSLANSATTLDSSATTNAAAAATAAPRTTTAAVQNGSHVHPQLHADAPVTSAAAKPAEPPAPAAAVHRSTRPVPKAPTSQSSAMSSDPTAAPKTPVKAPGDASKPYHFQFGTISPGFMNGMQVPARTNSAPPNLDEQKRDQARHDSFRPPPPLPIPTAPKQQFPRKDAVSAEQSNTGEAHSVPKVKKDVQVSPVPPASQPQKPPVLPPMSGMSMPMQYHQPQVSVQFAGPNQQLQSQGMTAAPLQMQLPMGLSMANAPQVQPPMFLHQPHPMQQGIIHQSQYTAQMGPQLPPQLGNMGMGMTPPYPQQQGGKFGGPRKTTVKITHPDTHEELRLDKRADSYSDGGSSAPRSLPNMPPQSQPIPSFAPSHPHNYYTPNSFNASSMFYPSQSSVPLTSSQLAPNSQAPRFNYPVGQNPQNMGYMNPALNSLPVNKTGTPMHVTADLPNLEHARDVHNIISSAPPTVIPITVKPTPGSIGEKVADSLQPKSSHGVEKSEPTKHVRPSGEVSPSHPQREVTESWASKSLPVATKQSVVVSAAVSSEGLVSNPSSSASVSPSEESVPVVPINEGRRRETLGRSNSIKDYQKKIGKKGLIQSQHQVGSQSASISSLPSRALEQGISPSSGVFGSVEAKTTVATPTPVTSEGVSSTQQSLSNVSGGTPDASELKSDTVVEASYSVSSEISGARIVVDTLETVHQAKLDKSSSQDEELVNETVGKDEQGDNSLPAGSTEVINSSEISSEPISLKSSEFNKQTEVKQSGHDSGLKVVSDEVLTIETAQKLLDEPMSHYAEIDGTTDNLEILNSTDLGSSDVGSSHGEKTSTVDASSSRSDSIGSNEIGTMSGTSDQQSAPIPAPDLKEATSKHEGEDAETIGGGLAPLPASGAKDKPVLDQNKAKITSKATKKKRKEILLKADAAGTTSDLYNAYKGPEEKKETILSTDYTESISTVNVKQAPADAVEVDAVASEKGGLNKAEPDDWEDAADLSTPKLEVSDDGQLIHGGLDHYDHDGDGSMAKKYSRDFLLKFSEQCTDLPEDFEITSDIEALMSANLNLSHVAERDSYPSPGRIVDRPSGGSRLDRRGSSSSSMGEEDRWGRLSGHFAIRDVRLDPVPVYVSNTGFRPGPGGNFGVLRNPRGQAPMQYPGGILSGPSMGSQGGMPRNSPDSDRWLRNANIQQKGLIPSPHTPLLMMHKAEKKYEVGKVTDEEQAKQRQLKAILNKLTPQNFDKLFEQVKAVNIDNPDTLTGVISQIFDKALMEPTFCEMYANFCSHLSLELPDFSKDNEKITFKRVLLNKCQEEFERGEREQEEADKADEEGEIKQSAEEREEKRIKARRRMLGNIRLIGELYKKKMLTERIMHACIQKLLGGQYDNPDEENIEALCKLMSTIGEMIDHSKAKENMDAYFERMKMFSNNMNLSSRVRFMLKDSIDLRKNKWQQRRKVEGPKKIEEVHRDAAQERQAQTSRLGRGSINTSTRRTPMDFGSRGSTMLSPSSAQMGGFRGLPSQVRGFGGQDVRFEDRVPYEARTLSVPLTQRPIGDDSITLGPQGGLARGMSIRGPPAMSSAPAAEISPGAADSRRMAVALNGYSMVSERTTYGPREELVPRYIQERFAAPAAYDQSSPQERNVNFSHRDLRNPDRSFDRSVVTSPTPRMEGAAVPQNVPSEKLPEERLKDMSIAAIKEFYSARDEKEVELCIRDMNAPSFHPSMVSLWVTDSFERKDLERDDLTKLLVNLTKSRDGVLNQAQLIKGFESVMTNLEDAVNDAPRAPEFLGRLFAKVITENVVSLSEIGRLIYQGGEEPGCLLELGLAADVLGSTLEVIKSEKGDSVLNEQRKSSNLRIEDFRPPNPNKSRKLDKFI